MTIPAVIQAVPWDQNRVWSAVTNARQSGAEIVWAGKEEPIHDTYRRALAVAGDGPLIFMQDDIQLCTDWYDRIHAAIAETPDDFVTFFSRRKDDLTIGSRREPGRTFLMHQCHYMPAGMAQSVITYSYEWKRQRPEVVSATDYLVADWLKDHGWQYRIHVPSLVQHREYPSELGPRSSRRFSPTFAG